MKKFFALLLALVMMFCFTGCEEEEVVQALDIAIAVLEELEEEDIAAVILPYRGLVIPYQNLEKRKAEVGSRFRGSIPEKETPDLVYRMYNIPPLYSEMHYFDIRIKTIKTPEELPEDKPVVYVFASSVPSAPDRTWERLYAEFHRNQEIELWKGKLKTEDDYE